MDGDDSSGADESDMSDYDQDKSDDDESGGDRKVNLYIKIKYFKYIIIL